MLCSVRNLAIVVALLLSVRPTFSEAVNSAPVSPPLTVDDYAQISQLYATYGFVFDNGVDNAQTSAAISSIFTADGRHVCGSCRQVDPYIHYSGQETLTKFATGELGVDTNNGLLIRANPQNLGNGPHYIRHIVANVFLQPVPGGVNSRAYLLYQRVSGPSGQIELQSGGIYYDFVVRTEKGWRFRHKNILSVGFAVPNSLSPTFDRASLIPAATAARVTQ